MHTTTRTAHATRLRIAAAAAALAAGVIALSGCAPAGPSGTFYHEGVNGTDYLGQLVVDGNTVTHHEYDCDGVYEEPDVTSSGEFNDDQTQVIWSVAGEDQRNERIGTEPTTVSDNTIGISGDVYVNAESDAGKTLLETFEEQCSE